jgi:ATP-dependent Lon protease
MTGEISLRGNVLAIGGLKEKTMAAYTGGAKTVLIPWENQRDLEELDPMARENLSLIPCRKISDVLDHALLPTHSITNSKPAEESVAAAQFNVPLNVPTPGVGQIRCEVERS